MRTRLDTGCRFRAFVFPSRERVECQQPPLPESLRWVPFAMRWLDRHVAQLTEPPHRDPPPEDPEAWALWFIDTRDRISDALEVAWGEHEEGGMDDAAMDGCLEAAQASVTVLEVLEARYLVAEYT